MAVKLSALRKREIRRKIVFVNEMGEKDTITIKNPNGDAKATIVEFLGKKLQKDSKELVIDPKDIMMNFLPLLTDIEIDEEDIDYIIENPSSQLIEVHYHIAEIVQEIINEMLMQQSSQLSLASQHEVISDIETKVEKINKNTTPKPRKKKATTTKN